MIHRHLIHGRVSGSKREYYEVLVALHCSAKRGARDSLDGVMK